VGESLIELQEVERELRLPSNYSLDLAAAVSASDLLHIVRRTNVVICCFDVVKFSLEVAATCASEGTHFVGNLETESSLRRLKGLHFLAKMHACAIVPLCSRDVTMSELGIWILAASFAPGTLMEASLFRPLPRTYKDMFWDTALLASERISQLVAVTSLTHQMGRRTAPIVGEGEKDKRRQTSSSSTPTISSSTSQSTPSTPMLDKLRDATYFKSSSNVEEEKVVPLISVSPLSETSSSLPVSSPNADPSFRIRPNSSLENLSADMDVTWHGFPSSGLRSKAKSFGDLDELSTLDVRILDGAMPVRRARGGAEAKKKRRVASHLFPRTPLLPSINQVLHSQTLVSQIESEPKGSTNPVVRESLETTPTQLCSARGSLTPVVLSTTSLLPESSESAAQMEVHHLSTIGAGSRLFSFLFRVFLFLFLLVPLLRGWISKWAPTDTNVGPLFGPTARNKIPKEEEHAKLRFYAHRSPTTITPSVLRTIDPKGTVKHPLTSQFTTRNSLAIVVGGLGTNSQYLASSSTQPTESLKFVEVKAPGHLGPMHATVVCMCLTAIALTRSEASPGATTGVVPPLSAGGKVLKELLTEEGFKAISVSYGRKKK